MKLDKRKKYFMVLDVETTNNDMTSKFNDGLVYDIGFGVYDKQGNTYCERSYCVKEIFNDKNLMNSAYYKEKLPKYYEELKQGKREIKTILEIRKIIKKAIEYFNIEMVFAYNANFDYTTLNNSIRYITSSFVRWFFPYGVKIGDIWHIACQVLGTQKTFQFENVRNENGNLKTSAERMFAYISQNEEFEEEHIGISDVRIEKEILIRCLKSHKKIDKNINRACWRIPQTALA
jgi:DNA polymerase III epsilon subunit-like protein